MATKLNTRLGVGNPTIVTDVDTLTEIIAEAIAELVPATTVGPAPLLDRAGLAQALACSIPQIDRLRRRGAPCVMVGDSPRFIFADVISFLRARGGQ